MKASRSLVAAIAIAVMMPLASVTPAHAQAAQVIQGAFVVATKIQPMVQFIYNGWNTGRSGLISAVVDNLKKKRKK